MNILEKSALHCLGSEDGQPMALDLRIEHCGHYPMTDAAARTHPTPPFSRIFLFMEGAYCDVTMDGRTRRLQAGRFWLIPLYRTIHVRYARGGHFFFVHFTAQAASGLDIFSSLREIAELPPTPALARRLVRSFGTQAPDGPLCFQAAVLEVVARFVRRPEVLSAWRGNALPTSYRRVLEYVREHNRHGLRIGELARLVHMTPDALRKGFRRTIGVPLKTYLLNDLLHRALELLFEGDLNVKQIADALGYPNPFYFGRVFKRVMHIAPLQYRRDSHGWMRPVQAHRL